MEQVEDDNNSLPASSLRDDYEANGFVGPIDVLTPREAAAILEEFHEWRATLPEQKVAGDVRFNPHLFLPFCNRIVRHPALIAAVQQVLNSPDILCWSSDFNIKEAHSPHYFSPHQDSTYAGLEPAGQVVTAWVALSDPVARADGCLQFWPGSHRKGQLPHTEHVDDDSDRDDNNLLSRGQRCNVDDFGALLPKSVELRGGQASLHSFHTVHQSGPNGNSRQARIGLAVRFMTARVRQTGTAARESVTWISSGSEQQHGKKNHHCGFDVEPILPLDAPTAAHVERGQQAHAVAVQREAANYFATCACQRVTSYDQQQQQQAAAAQTTTQDPTTTTRTMS